jgi:hypothetical protein
LLFPNRPIFAMTQMVTTLNHVVNWAHAELKQWKQLMDYCHELTYFINLGDRAMETIMWRVNYEFTKFQATYAHLGQNALYLQEVILNTRHLVDKLIKWPFIKKIAHYRQCLPHSMKPN